MREILKQILLEFDTNRDSSETKKYLSILRQCKFKQIQNVPAIWPLLSKYKIEKSNINDYELCFNILVLYSEYIQGSDIHNGSYGLIESLKSINTSTHYDTLILDLFRAKSIKKQLTIIRFMLYKLKKNSININFIEIYDYILNLNSSKDQITETKLTIANKYFM